MLSTIDPNDSAVVHPTDTHPPFQFKAKQAHAALVAGARTRGSRCNMVIGPLGRSDAMLWVYLYRMSRFCVFSLTMSVVLPSLFFSSNESLGSQTNRLAREFA